MAMLVLAAGCNQLLGIHELATDAPSAPSDAARDAPSVDSPIGSGETCFGSGAFTACVPRPTDDLNYPDALFDTDQCATFGTVPVAGYTVAIRIFLFTLLPCWGMSGAAATLVGQNLGAKKPERAEAAVYQTGRFTMIYMGAVALASIVYARQVVAFFTSDPAVQQVASDCLRFISAGNICYAWGMVLIQAFNGAGDTRTPMAVNFFCYWCFQIPLAWVLAVTLHGGPRGVFAAIPAAETAMTLASLVLFRRGTWKRKLI